MFTHKKIKEIIRGNPVPNGSKYIRTETRKVLVAEGPYPQYDIYDYRDIDIYEIPCNEDGSTEPKVTYESRPIRKECYCGGIQSCICA